MVYKKESDLFTGTGIEEKNNTIFICDKELFKNKTVDDLADTLISSESLKIKQLCYWIIHQAAVAYAITPASIHDFYQARGKNKFSDFTVPAVNIRTLTYDLSRAIFRSAIKSNAGALIFEIAISEIAYSNQRPLDYASIIFLAAIKEGYSGPIFIQGDHFQVRALSYLENKKNEINRIKAIIWEAVDAGFYNIDIDTSTLVDLFKVQVCQQQKLNYELCAFFTKFIRKIQPKKITISIGGEIGEVGGKNSTAQELNAFMEGYLRKIKNSSGICRLSIQTGTTHGGVVLPDGTIAKVKLDFETLKTLSKAARKKYKLAGCVQHGASTLPNEAFNNFPDSGCAEIHLATQLQNIVYNYLPLPLKEKIYEWLNNNYAHEKKPGQTSDQFIYTTRKYALGPFKKEIYALPRDLKQKIANAIETEFNFLFHQLRVTDTKDLVRRYTSEIFIKKEKNDFFREQTYYQKLAEHDD
jgi:fructose/tagatose bisphosphate aldolase